MGGLIKLYNKASWIFLIVGITLTFGIGIYFVDIKPPKFGQQLTNNITTSEALMSRIGGWKQTQFSYSDSAASRNTFHIKVIGMCNSASVVIHGFYTGDSYMVSDTIIHACE